MGMLFRQCKYNGKVLETHSVCTYSSDIAVGRAIQKQRHTHMAEQQPAGH